MCVCVCVCALLTAATRALGGEPAVIIKGTKHWRLKTHERKRNIQANQGAHKHALSLMHKTHTDAHRFTLSPAFCPARLYYKHATMLYQSQNGIRTTPDPLYF